MMQLPISKQQITIGTRHEMEHTKSKRLARKIALDHLVEFPTYYKHLAVDERKMAVERRRLIRRLRG